MDSGSTGNGSQLRTRSDLYPWNKPQSTRTRAVPASTSVRDPVTHELAPRNVSWNGRVAEAVNG